MGKDRSIWQRLKKAASSKKTAAAKGGENIELPAANENTPTDLQLGRLFAELILKASAASSLDMKEMQFNFCLLNANGQPLLSPASRERIKECINQYLLSDVSRQAISADDHSTLAANLNTIASAFPDDAANLHDYAKTLNKRGGSFHDAAMLILDHSDAHPKNIQEAKEKIAALKSAFEAQLAKLPATPEIQQARYDGYMKRLTTILANTLNKDESEITHHLQEVETIVNIKQNKPQITLSGTVTETNGILHGDNIHLQIDEPRNRFCDLSNAQRKEWVDVYNQRNESPPHYPEWFEQRSNIEKKIWLGRMAEVMRHQPNPGEATVNMAPVVKKQGFPGLRNLALSSFATLQVSNDGKATVKDISARSVRSSNLIVQPEDENKTLSDEQKKLTQDNIVQVRELYEANQLNKIAGGFTYAKDHMPLVLCQSLLRKIGGGDNYVISLKQEAVNKLNEHLNSDRYFSSNHCIGVHHNAGKAGHLIMHLAGANTIGIAHIRAPLDEFINLAVKNGKSEEQRTLIETLHQAALKGKYQGIPNKQTIAIFTKCGITGDEQIKSLDRVLQASSMYVRETSKKFSFYKTHQLHMAALEEIIYQDTGNYVQSSCKSGKDREAVEKMYRNAMRAFYTKYGRLAPSSKNTEEKSGDRQEFINIFIELFKSNHQARLAELNANGCQGLKALNNILPADILKALKSPQHGDLLTTHKNNSALNEIGDSNVKADPAELDRVMTQEYVKGNQTFTDYDDSTNATKVEGANNPGPHGGTYTSIDGTKQAIFKRDTVDDIVRYEKIIAEFIAGRLVSAILGEMHKNSDSDYAKKFTADVSLIRANPGRTAETADDLIYLRSVYLSGYEGDWWKVAFQAEYAEELRNSMADLLESVTTSKSSLAEELQNKNPEIKDDAQQKLAAKYKRKPIVTLPAIFRRHSDERIHVPSNRLSTNQMLLADFCDHAVTRIFVSDYGVHAGNFGQVKDPQTQKSRIGSFDYGAALKNLSPDFVIFSRLGTGTWFHKNHLLEYNNDVIKSEKMAESLIKLGNISSDFISNQAAAIITAANIPYSEKAIKKFCSHIGMKKADYQNFSGRNLLLTKANEFITSRLSSKKDSAKTQGCGLLLEHFVNQSLKEDGSIDNVKLQGLLDNSPYKTEVLAFIKFDLQDYSPILPNAKLDKNAIASCIQIQSSSRIYRPEAVIVDNLVKMANQELEKNQSQKFEDVFLKLLTDYSNKNAAKMDVVKFIKNDLRVFVLREKEIFDKLPKDSERQFQFQNLLNLINSDTFRGRIVHEVGKMKPAPESPQQALGFFHKLRSKLQPKQSTDKLQNENDGRPRNRGRIK